ncbi:MAG: HAMP domain-containing protein [Candidatus Desulfofervidaceae bacterium]|nr:HAMP domain-containing protein [Candidatus Desulfofervidaceae bacterium]
MMGRNHKHFTLRLVFVIPFFTTSLVLITSLWFIRAFLTEAGFKMILLSTGLLIGIAFIAGLALAMAISRPLRTLEDKAQAVIQGDLAQEITLPLRDELGSLGHIFNEMIAAFNKYLKESMEAGVVVINNKGFITSTNYVANQIFNIPQGAMEGKHYTEVFAPVPELLSLIKTALAEQKPFSVQEMKMSKEELILNVGVSVFKEPQNLSPGLVIFFREVSQLKEFQRQLAHADRLAYLGTLTAGLAHEIRNPLAGLQSLVELVETNLTNPQRCQRYLEEINKVITRLNSLVTDMLAYAHADPEEFKLIEINQLLENTLTMLDYEFNINEFEIIKDFSSQPLTIMGDEAKLIQAFNNVIRNSLQATPSGGTLIIATALTHKKVTVEITNTGSYIPPEKQEAIFVPFYTTKSNGTGLGLPIAKRIIESHGGKIELKSSPEKVTTFIVELPISK